MTAPAPQLADVSITTFNTQDAELNLLQVFQQFGAIPALSAGHEGQA